MSDSTRKRSPNWLPSEKELLVSLVELHFDIIENKKTDTASVKTKLAQWEVISEEYNSRTTHYSRTGANLKAQWESMKKLARKDAANKRKQMIQSGGEPLIHKKEDRFQQRIIRLIGSSTAGALNQYEKDSSVTAERDEIVILPVAKEELSDAPQFEYIDTEMSSAKSSQSSDSDVESETEQIVTKDWAQYTHQKLRTPVSQARHNKASRRRPTYTSTSSLEKLNKKKLKAIEVQTQLAVEEMERSKTLHDIDVQIKKQILKQEKIKTNILLIKQRQLLTCKKRK